MSPIFTLRKIFMLPITRLRNIFMLPIFTLVKIRWHRLRHSNRHRRADYVMVIIFSLPPPQPARRRLTYFDADWRILTPIEVFWRRLRYFDADWDIQPAPAKRRLQIIDLQIINFVRDDVFWNCISYNIIYHSLDNSKARERSSIWM